MTSLRNTLLAAAAVLAVTTAPALAQYPVIDQAVGSNTGRAASAIADQVNLLTDIKGINESTLKSIGSFGAPKGGITSQASAWSEFKDGGKFAEALKAFKFDTCAPTGCSSGESPADIASARNYILNNFYSGKAVNAQAGRDYAEVRARASRDAALSGYSISMLSRDHLARSSERGTALENIVASSEDLRADVRANSAVTIAQHQQMTHMLALLTSLVEMEATKGVKLDNEFVVSGGGSTPPNVHKEEEFTADGRRLTINGSGRSSTP